ncbi:helix-turn-helix transcriptional regulator [Cognatiyoonia sp. IB215182]|uniref:ArsR/SmtB family transcription factor n=1 Tax=Cognatiyoonia sp. IB215182 TaxID=3097353 RepID=UPI002A0D27BE|nr:helix-turn-helix transcriptional regulator [Cognatiyoonia sp. IB215182]MDX8352767.1 helix-turn-helix transcriptional regulator [Cognatiyoonia sp. IB215182]
MESNDAITGLSALAHDGRLDLFRRLVQAGPSGMPAGALASAAGSAFTTTSAQLNVLSQARLVTSQRVGRSVIYAANYDTIRGLFAFLLEDCCQRRPEILQDLITTNPDVKDQS